MRNAASRKQRKFQPSSDLNDRVVARFLPAIEMSLTLGIDVARAEYVCEPTRNASSFIECGAPTLA